MVFKSRESPYSWLLAPQAPPSSRSPPIRSIHSDSTFESRLKLAIHRDPPPTVHTARSGFSRGSTVPDSRVAVSGAWMMEELGR